MARLISSQRHVDDEIVAEKREMRDYGVSVSPEFELFGEQVRVILDGHHSWHAAKLDGERPLICEMDATDHDAVGLLEAGNVEDFLAVTRIDSDLYDIVTGHDL